EVFVLWASEATSLGSGPGSAPAGAQAQDDGGWIRTEGQRCGEADRFGMQLAGSVGSAAGVTEDSWALVTSSILRNSRTIKFHSWEGAFLHRVLGIQGQELRTLWTSGLLFSLSLLSFQASTFPVASL
ncbi:hypothetical protein P7K49_040927, partial [Saguinus oedipus]